MATALAKIEEVEAEIARTQKNKATMGHLGLLKAKLAKLRRELLAPPKASRGCQGGSGGGEGFDVTKTGDARIGLVGFPSVGKSTLLNKLTNTESEVAAYEFTTLTCIPGVIYYKGAKLQLLDLPGIIEGAHDGKGRGRQVIAVARSCNLILIVLDATKPATVKRLVEHELEGFGIRLNKRPPRISFRKRDKGGISLTSAVQSSSLDIETVKAICSEYRVHNADITLREDATADDLIDVIEGNRKYVPAIYVINKVDCISEEEVELWGQLPNAVLISGDLEWNLGGLLEMIWEKLNLIRVYTKPKGEPADFEAPVILRNDKKHCTVESFCNKLHKNIMKEFKYALVWGNSVKFNPQKLEIWPSWQLVEMKLLKYSSVPRTLCCIRSFHNNSRNPEVSEEKIEDDKGESIARKYSVFGESDLIGKDNKHSWKVLFPRSKYEATTLGSVERIYLEKLDESERLGGKKPTNVVTDTSQWESLSPYQSPLVQAQNFPRRLGSELSRAFDCGSLYNYFGSEEVITEASPRKEITAAVPNKISNLSEEYWYYCCTHEEDILSSREFPSLKVETQAISDRIIPDVFSAVEKYNMLYSEKKGCDEKNDSEEKF
eukprot:jgi/Galph1/5023/GphlegSOOS_G3667.1